MRPHLKRLALMRHAKSSWKNAELADFDRPLNKRGLSDAPLMGERLASRDFATDLIISSPARRALVTARTVAECLGYPIIDIREEPTMYLADPDTLLEIVRETDDRYSRLMLFGHNPGFTHLANSLGDLHVDNMPTASIAVFEFVADHWTEIDYGEGRIILFDFPKNTDKS